MDSIQLSFNFPKRVIGYKKVPLITRFQAKVQKPTEQDGCWLWMSHKDRHGYGRITIKGRSYLAHRVSFELFVGLIPHGLHVLHRCDNPPCVNPAHLWLGTSADNTADMVRKGRARGGNGGRSVGGSCLTGADVVSIRLKYAQGGITHRELGAFYGVTKQAISAIIQRKTWKHIE